MLSRTELRRPPAHIEHLHLLRRSRSWDHQTAARDAQRAQQQDQNLRQSTQQPPRRNPENAQRVPHGIQCRRSITRASTQMGTLVRSSQARKRHSPSGSPSAARVRGVLAVGIAFRASKPQEDRCQPPEPRPKGGSLMKVTRSELLDLVYQFYPRGMLQFDRMHVPPGELVYNDTEEHCRLMVAAARGRREWSTWKAMISRLGDRHGVQDESLHLHSGNIDPAYSGRIWLVLGKTSINFHVSLLGPYYGIQLPGVPEEEPVAREIAREIEATYPGYQTIPPEIGNEVVPDVAVLGELGTETIYTLLFSEVWTRVYKDLDTNWTLP